MSPVYVLVLIVKLVAFPNMPGIMAGVYATEGECRAAAAALDRSTEVILKLTCEVRT